MKHQSTLTKFAVKGQEVFRATGGNLDMTLAAVEEALASTHIDVKHVSKDETISNLVVGFNIFSNYFEIQYYANGSVEMRCFDRDTWELTGTANIA